MHGFVLQQGSSHHLKAVGFRLQSRKDYNRCSQHRLIPHGRAAFSKDCFLKASSGKLSLGEVRALAAEGASKSTQLLVGSHLSLAGASGKVGL